VTEPSFIPHRFGGPDYILTQGLVPVPLIRCELRTLAQVDFCGFVSDTMMNRPSEIDQDALRSLIRFALVSEGELRQGPSRSPGIMLTETGRRVLSVFRPQRFGCRCVHAVTLPCFCSELTFCPNPDHGGNGCHGSHD
jgi:hypothetical protein